MPNSKYPQELDTSVEIPPVRDNITEIGSDVINSLRSAIFKIEAALGINPQGATGNTVASRLSRSLDANGNILEDALSRANVLTGPIIDTDVSRVAAIQESKLKLDFPTTLLQDEISILTSELNTLQSVIQELSTTLAIHLEPRALDRHPALSISTSTADVVASDVATLLLEDSNLQDVLEEIYNSHINYTGANISALNNSHKSSQIFFDPENVNDVIFSSDVQGAIEDLANIENIGFRNALLNITSNGRIRKGSVTDGFENNNTNTILIPTASATYIQAAGDSTTTFSYSTKQNTLGSISKFDLLILAGSENEDDNTSYQISEVITDASGLVQSIIVYGGPKSTSITGLTIQIVKNPYVNYNSAGFACVARPRSTKTNTPDVQVLNPDCATVISSGLIASNITSSNHTFNINIDGGDIITINTYDSTASDQTVDSIIQKINDQFVDQHLNTIAYKFKTNNCFEIAIAHNLPNISGDIVERTIKISPGSTNDGTTSLGFTNFINDVVKGSTGNSLNINGLILTDFGSIQEFDSSTISLVSTTLNISLSSGTFAELGVRVGDLVIITGSSNSNEDGSYRIASISGGIAILDLSGITFSGSLSTNSKVYIVRATANISEMNFEEVSSANGTIIFDVFMSENKDIFYSKRMEVDGSLRSGSFYAVVSDASKDFILANETATLSITSTGYATLTDPSLQNGSAVYVGSTGIYKIYDSDGLSFIILDVNATAEPLTNLSVTLHGFNEVSSNNYHLCRGSFATALGRVLGSSTDPGIPSLSDKRRSGTADHSIVGESFIEKYIEGPRNELRSGGVIRGCEVTNTTYTNTGAEIFQNFSVSAGIIVVNGIRREFAGLNSIRIDTGSTYVVVMDENGCIQAANYIDDPESPGTTITPFFENNVVYLAEVTNNSSTATATDLRLFIDNVDYKFLGEITVANDAKHGHFTDIGKAVAYSKRFSKMFPDMSTPSIFIKSGTYQIGDTITIDFDLKIRGSGPGTLLTKTAAFAPGTALTGSAFDMGTAIFLIGSDSNTAADDIVVGVDFSDFAYSTSTSITNVGVVFAITQPLVKLGTVLSRQATYRFNNISFSGPETIDGSAADPNKIGEYAIVIGQQNPSTLAATPTITMGNVIVTNCRFNRMGLETGAIKFTESAASTFKDIVVCNNIVTRGSPNVGSSVSVVIEYPTTPTTENIIEIGNSFRTGS